jgi:hypothetical protein
MNKRYKTTTNGLALINLELHNLYEDNQPLHLTVDGRPKLHILSFEPLAYEEYGTFRNRAPHIAGSLALRKFLYRKHPYGGAEIYAGLESGTQAYGFELDAYNPNDVNTINNVATVVGLSEIGRFNSI